jgi:hypothetical protein
MAILHAYLLMPTLCNWIDYLALINTILNLELAPTLATLLHSPDFPFNKMPFVHQCYVSLPSSVGRVGS